MVGSVDRLERLQAYEHPSDYYNNRFHPGDASILLSLAEDGGSDVCIRVRCTKAGSRVVASSSGHADPEKLLQGLNRDVGLLDRATFDRFVDDTPLKRGRSFASLLGHVQLSEMRQALETLVNRRSVEADLETKTLTTSIEAQKRQGLEIIARLQVAHRRLLGAAAAEPVDAEVISRAAVSALSNVELLKPFIMGKDLQAIDFDAVRAVVGEADVSGRRKHLVQINEAIERLEKMAPTSRA